MGKNRIIKSLGRCIGNVALHKLLVELTNKPESKNHLESEVLEYGSDAFEKAQMFNWNEDDKARVREIAIRRTQNLIGNYPDVSFDDGDCFYIGLVQLQAARQSSIKIVVAPGEILMICFYQSLAWIF